MQNADIKRKDADITYKQHFTVKVYTYHVSLHPVHKGEFTRELQ